MPLQDDLKWLARLPRTSTPFLSLYLNTRWDSEKQRERVRIFVKNELRSCASGGLAGSGNGGKGVAEDVEKFEHYVKGLVNREWDEEFAGVALFACSGAGVFRIVRSNLPFEDRFVCSDRPLLRPAVEQSHLGQSALLAVAAGDAGRVLAFELGGVRKEISFRDEEFPGRHDQGGWSQARYQRHVEEHIHRNLKRLAGHLVRWSDERGAAKVLLSGPEALVAAFEEHLPKRVLAMVCARLRAEASARPEDLSAEAMRALSEARDREDGEAVRTLLDRGVGTGRSAVGPEPVAEAVVAGKVHRLYIDAGFRESGWRCLSCGAMGVRIPLGCPACGGQVEGVDLGEEYVRATLATDGTVITLYDNPDLQQGGGVAAQMRYGSSRAPEG